MAKVKVWSFDPITRSLSAPGWARNPFTRHLYVLGVHARGGNTADLLGTFRRLKEAASSSWPEGKMYLYVPAVHSAGLFSLAGFTDDLTFRRSRRPEGGIRNTIVTRMQIDGEWVRVYISSDLRGLGQCQFSFGAPRVSHPRHWDDFSWTHASNLQQAA